MRDAPVIGITCDFETITDRRGCPSPRYICPKNYVDALLQMGAVPLLLPYTGSARADVAPFMDRIHGLLISGGDFDVPPSYYGEAPHEKLGAQLPERFAFERALLELALIEDMPILAVCAGMQLLNVVLGGTIYQDLSLRPGTDVHEQPHDKRQPGHSIEVTSGSRLRALVNEAQLSINSTHHQVLNCIATDLNVCGRASDGVVEAVEMPTKRFVLGVQWHPEALGTFTQLEIYRGFVEACRDV